MMVHVDKKTLKNKIVVKGILLVYILFCLGGEGIVGRSGII